MISNVYFTKEIFMPMSVSNTQYTSDEAFSVFEPFAIAYFNGESDKFLPHLSPNIKLVVQENGTKVLEGGKAELSEYAMRNLFPIFNNIASSEPQIGKWDCLQKDFENIDHVSFLTNWIVRDTQSGHTLIPQVNLCSVIKNKQRKDSLTFSLEKNANGVLKISSIIHNILPSWS